MSIIFGKLVDFTHSYETPQYVMLFVLIIGGSCWFGIDASKNVIIDPGGLNIVGSMETNLPILKN
jgi:hypothetical protein